MTSSIHQLRRGGATLGERTGLDRGSSRHITEQHGYDFPHTGAFLRQISVVAPCGQSTKSSDGDDLGDLLPVVMFVGGGW